jgi:hypothetical protein
MTPTELLARLLLAGKGHTQEEYKEYLQAAVFLPAVVVVLVSGSALDFGLWFWASLVAASAMLIVARQRWLLIAVTTGFIAARFMIKLVLTQQLDALVGSAVFGTLTWVALRRLERVERPGRE